MHQSAIAVLTASGRYSFRHNTALGSLPEVYHLGAGIRLLEIVGHRHTVELGRRIVSLKNGAWIFPCNGRSRLHLSPAQMRAATLAEPSFGDKVQYTATPLSVTRIPILHRTVFDVGIFLHYYLHYGGMELVLITHRRGASLHIAHLGSFIGHYQSALKLSGTPGIDTEIT